GFATYRLTLAHLPAGRYRMHLPIVYAASRAFVNGVEVSRRGDVGETAAATHYDWRAHDIAFESAGEDVRLSIDIAAFRHRDTGLESAPVLGLSDPMASWIALKWAQEFLALIALMLLGIYALAVFLYRKRDRASLFFAIACFGYIPASAILGFDNILSMLFPSIALVPLMMLLYLPTEVSLGAFLAYVNALYPEEAWPRVYRALMAVVAVLFAVQAATLALGETLLASKENRAFILIIAAILAYMVAVLVRAVARRRDGALIFLLGVLVFFATVLMVATVAYGILPSDRVTGIDFTAYGMLILLFSHIVILAERWSLAIIDAERTNDDLRQLLDVNSAITSEMQLAALLKKIVEVTSKILHADRSSLFLYDEKADELWSLVAEGVETRQIRFPAGRGLAGHVVRTGETVNAARAYEDPRFNPEVDQQTGYRTKSALTMPVTARDGRRLGVMQALNRHDRPCFTRDDEIRLQAFAAQAAIAIDNASLFTAVAAERNYNESILRSMSAGVVTLDRDGRLATINDAACAILEVEADAAQGRNARAFLKRIDSWLLGEIDAVAADGQRRRRLDADITTARGNPISANVTIVPLVRDGGADGLLILVEDISQRKRLEGAMRRFMPQNLVEQVIERREELLEGAACTASVLFADIRDFSALAETLPPRETVEVLNEIFGELYEAVVAHGGVLDKFIGDAVMAVYGAPISSGRDPQNAVASALAMQRAIDGINERRAAKGLTPIRLGIGIATGEVIAGTVGSSKRMDYTVIGDSVNLAARLEELSKIHDVGILVCETTARAVEQEIRLRALKETQVRGRTRPERIFEVLQVAQA
ncbi:MAG: GAF domain-containing protein, partial [Sphingomonadaceae bacterium]|nr:GAF domain-containing protein [Sphingomonadaceae bacterium]